MLKTTVLKSGLKVVSQVMTGTQAVTTLVMCGAGSRYETKELNGISHFLEHMFFKGAKKYPNCKAVAEAIDSIGGEFNAFTGKEYVGYYVTTPKEKYLKGYDVLSDMLVHPKFEESEIERERGVILEEMNMYEDLPMQRVHEHFEEQIFGDNPLGWNIIGTKDVIAKMSRNDFMKYKNQQYVPDNIVVAVFGAINQEEVVSNVEKYFNFTQDSTARKPYTFSSFNNYKQINLITKPTEQAHLIIGFEAFGSEDSHRKYIHKLLAIILGGNMSSRMFLSVRERQGLCYYIRTQYSGYQGAGYLATSLGVDIARIKNAISAIKKEYEEIQKSGITKSELVNAKEYLKGKMIIGLEDSGSLAEFYAQQLVVTGQVKSIEEIKAEIDSVQVDEVNKLAEEIFDMAKIRLSVIGPFESEEELAIFNA